MRIRIGAVSGKFCRDRIDLLAKIDLHPVNLCFNPVKSRVNLMELGFNVIKPSFHLIKAFSDVIKPSFNLNELVFDPIHSNLKAVNFRLHPFQPGVDPVHLLR